MWIEILYMYSGTRIASNRSVQGIIEWELSNQTRWDIKYALISRKEIRFSTKNTTFVQKYIYPSVFSKYYIGMYVISDIYFS